MTTETITVPGIHCDHCASSLEGALAEVSGVIDAKVNLEPKTIDVSFDDSAVTVATIVKVIEDQGYDVPR